MFKGHQGSAGVSQGVTRGSARGQVGVSHSGHSVRDDFKWSNSVQIWVEKGVGYFKIMFKKWSAMGHQGVSQGSPWGQPVVIRG